VRVQITARHCELPDPVRERTKTQISRLVRYDDRLSSAEVVFDEEKHTRKVEGILHVDGAPVVVAQGEDTEFRAALDKMTDRLARMLKEGRARLVDHKAPPLAGDAPAD